MAVITGTFDTSNRSNVGRTVQSDDLGMGDGIIPSAGRIVGTGDVQMLQWVAESAADDSTAPCWKATGPVISGWPVRLSAWPVTGFAPTADFVLTIKDDIGSTYTVSIDKDGSNDHFTTLPGPLVGRITMSCDDFGTGSLRMAFGLVVDANEKTGTSTAVFNDDIGVQSGLKCATVDYPSAGSNGTVLTSGRLHLSSATIRAGQIISDLTFSSGSTAATSPTNWWLAIYDKDLNLLANTADQTTTAIAANTNFIISLSSSWTCPLTDRYYLGIMIVASGVPTQKRAAMSTSGHCTINSVVLNGYSTTGLTTTPPDPAAAITEQNVIPFLGGL